MSNLGAQAQVAGALESFRARAEQARRELASVAYDTKEPAEDLNHGRMALIYRLEGYLEGYLEALKLAPPQVAAECFPEARALLQDLAAILVTAD